MTHNKTIQASSRLVTMAKSAAKSKWGQALKRLGPEFEQMAVALELVTIIAGQDLLGDPEKAQRQAARIILACSEVVL